jgi:hypothetical protein
MTFIYSDEILQSRNIAETISDNEQVLPMVGD